MQYDDWKWKSMVLFNANFAVAEIFSCLSGCQKIATSWPPSIFNPRHGWLFSVVDLWTNNYDARPEDDVTDLSAVSQRISDANVLASMQRSTVSLHIVVDSQPRQQHSTPRSPMYVKITWPKYAELCFVTNCPTI